MKKKLPLYFIAVLILYLLQATVFQYIRIMGVKPNLLLVFVCIMAYLRGSNEGMFLGLFTGLFADVLAGKYLGFYGLIFMLAGFCIGSVPRKLFWDNIAVILIFTAVICIPVEFAGYWINKLAEFISRNTEELLVEPGQFLIKIILPETLYNSIIFPLLYILGKKLDVFFNKDVKEFVD